MNESQAVWYAVLNQQQTGPYEFPQLQALAAQGRLRPTDLVWRAGQPSWVNAQTIPGLFAAEDQIVEPEVVTMPPTLTPGGGELVIPEAASGPYERPRRPYPEEEPEGAGFYDLICVHFHRTFIFSLQQMPITDGE